jgi:hypothetical protein
VKTALLVVLFALSLADYARASGAVTIEITTTDAGTSYTLHKQGYYAGMASTTPDEIETWLRSAVDRIGERESILIYANERASFKVVAAMLSRLKAAGAKRFAVCIGTGADVRPALSANLDDIRLHRSDTASSPK